MVFEETEIIFWDNNNGARKTYDKEFDSKEKAVEFGIYEFEVMRDRNKFIRGHRGVAVKTDKVSSITVSHLKGKDKPLE